MKNSDNSERNFLLFVIGFVLFLLSMHQCQIADELSSIKYVLERKL
jgi:hypothetical protein